MRVVELSDHPGAMLNAVHEQRRTAEQEHRSRHTEALTRHSAHVADVRRARDEARAQRRWWAWLRLAFSAWGQKRRVPRRAAAPAAPSDQEEILTAGIAGERMVAAGLGRALGDDWVLLRGYRNRRGEIDHVLVGPRGLLAMEVKHRNATVHIDGDDWCFDKFDRYGNLVGQGTITDRSGRSPSRQVNEAADELERFLHSRGQRVSIRRMVILTHPRSRLGSCKNLTVAVATSMDAVLSQLNSFPVTLRAPQAAELERLIEHDHHHYEARRPKR
jgi:hypothetical protein